MFYPDDAEQNNSLAKELAAQIQLGLYGTVGKLAKQMRTIDRIRPILKDGGIIRKVAVNREIRRRAAGISTATRHLPAWGGLLYAVGALEQELTVEGATIIKAYQDSRLDVGDMTWLEYERRLEWKSYLQVYDLLDNLFTSGRQFPDIIILDIPLVMGRDVYAQVLQDDELNSELKGEVEQLRDRVEAFWTANLSRCYPFDPAGPKIVSLGRRRFGSLLRLLESEGKKITPDPIQPEVLQLVQSRWHEILSIGIERLMTGILSDGHRTAAFEFQTANADERAFPKAILHDGRIGFHYLSGLRTEPVMVQTIGSAARWDAVGGSGAVDELAGCLIALTYFDYKKALPLPLWYAQEGVKVVKNKGPLEMYKRATLKTMQEEQVEQTWLAGWNAE